MQNSRKKNVCHQNNYYLVTFKPKIENKSAYLKSTPFNFCKLFDLEPK